MIDKILQLSLDEIKSGYTYNEESRIYTCLTCGQRFETGEVFPISGRFYDASRAVQLHIAAEHGNMLDTLTSFDKKYTSITENQKELLTLMYEGLPDSEIAKKTGIAPATVRHQRFVFREKAKLAKLYLAIFEVVEKGIAENKGKTPADELIDVHSGARMVDDRYFTTNSEEEKIIASAFESLEPLKLRLFSPKEKKKIVILRRIAMQFEKGRMYTEKEVNEILKLIYDDFATIRRYLIEYGFMKRTNNCKEYWLNE